MRKTGTTRSVRVSVRAARMAGCHEEIQTPIRCGEHVRPSTTCLPPGGHSLVKLSRWPHGRRWQVDLGSRRPGHPATLAAGSRVG